MAEQATGAVSGNAVSGNAMSGNAVSGSTEGATGTMAHPPTGHMEHNPGRPMSWIGVGVVIVGFLIGGVALVPSPTWWAFWLGVGIAVVGCLMLAFTKTFTEDWY